MFVCFAVCVFVCLSHFCHKCDIPQYLSQMNSELHETFRISSWGSPELIYNVCVRAHARVHAQCVKTLTLLLWLFRYFFWYVCCQFLVILKPFLTENEKKEVTFQIGSDEAQLVYFFTFFHFGKEVLQNGQNMQLRKKVIKYKSFPISSRTRCNFFVILPSP